LPKLGYLNLSRNALTDLPESIGDLEALGMLYLSHNALDSLPASIARMRKLKVLHVGSNKLSALPPGIDSLALSPPDTAGYSPAESFYYLDLSGNRLCGLSAA
jgi:Leucine-rich repeat (LRR) protein